MKDPFDDEDNPFNYKPKSTIEDNPKSNRGDSIISPNNSEEIFDPSNYDKTLKNISTSCSEIYGFNKLLSDIKIYLPKGISEEKDNIWNKTILPRMEKVHYLIEDCNYITTNSVLILTKVAIKMKQSIEILTPNMKESSKNIIVSCLSEVMEEFKSFLKEDLRLIRKSESESKEEFRKALIEGLHLKIIEEQLKEISKLELKQLETCQKIQKLTDERDQVYSNVEKYEFAHNAISQMIKCKEEMKNWSAVQIREHQELQKEKIEKIHKIPFTITKQEKHDEYEKSGFFIFSRWKNTSKYVEVEHENLLAESFKQKILNEIRELDDRNKKIGEEKESLEKSLIELNKQKEEIIYQKTSFERKKKEFLDENGQNHKILKNLKDTYDQLENDIKKLKEDIIKREIENSQASSYKKESLMEIVNCYEKVGMVTRDVVTSPLKMIMDYIYHLIEIPYNLIIVEDYVAAKKCLSQHMNFLGKAFSTLTKAKIKQITNQFNPNREKEEKEEKEDLKQLENKPLIEEIN
jgi:hypothetical protein